MGYDGEPRVPACGPRSTAPAGRRQEGQRQAKVVEALEFALGIFAERGKSRAREGLPRLRRLLRQGQPVRDQHARCDADGHGCINVLNDVSPSECRSTVRDRDGQPISFATGSAWAIPAKAEKPQAACRFARAVAATDAWLTAAKVRAAARAEDGKAFTGLLTANQKADDAIRQRFVKPSSQKVWDDAVQAVYAANEHTFAPGRQPGRQAELKTAWQGAVDECAQRPAGPAGRAHAAEEAQAALDKAW